MINSFEKMAANNYYRGVLNRFTHALLPFVLLTGFFTAGTCAGISCNTFPWVGENWFYSANHFLNRDEVPLWKNFTENKLICQVNHRTLATIMTLWATYSCTHVLRLRALTPVSRLSVLFLLLSLWTQLAIGVNVIWNNVPISLASSHQIGAMIVLTAVMFAKHNARGLDPRHIKNLLGKLKLEDRKKYEHMMKTFERNTGKKAEL